MRGKSCTCVSQPVKMTIVDNGSEHADTVAGDFVHLLAGVQGCGGRVRMCKERVGVCKVGVKGCVGGGERVRSKGFEKGSRCSRWRFHSPGFVIERSGM